ncbi:MAG: peptidoglycan binding domain-containing protein [Clostridia bacterium]|nr:peptidoglycan binding domain-containing protein [Clostridia bacterium]MBQ2152115.1 peptidoglycan binding domain-containing protein [Clostridia bacterium]
MSKKNTKGKSTSAKKTKKKKKGSGAALIAVLVFLLLLIVGYGSAGYYFSTHFLPGTRLNDVNVSLKSVNEARELIRATTDGYKVTLAEQENKSETIKGHDIGFEAVISDDFNKLVNISSGMAWAFRLFEDNDITLDENIISYKYDNDLLDSEIDKLDCVAPDYPVEAKDAELVLMDGVFKIIPEEESNVADRGKLGDEIRDALESRSDSVDLCEKKLYKQPKVFANDPDLAARKNACDEIADMTITLKFGTNEEVADVETIAKWIDVKAQGDGTYALETKEDAVAEYVKHIAETYNTFDSPKLFVTHEGESIEIPVSYYGWLLDDEYAVEELKKIVEAKKSVELDLTDRSEESDKWWIRVAVAYDVNKYYGNTYAEVSIAQQHMWMYVDGKVALESDVVTGNPSYGNDTPKGAFRLIYQERNATLRGPGYSTQVAYWMVFADDVGFHDATWQPYFGGDLYTWNGSHGCVNMPLDKAGELFELVYPGMAVFVY